MTDKWKKEAYQKALKELVYYIQNESIQGNLAVWSKLTEDNPLIKELVDEANTIAGLFG